MARTAGFCCCNKYIANVRDSGLAGIVHHSLEVDPQRAANQVWSYDFVFDWCANGQQLKFLTVSDEWTKEGLAIEVDGRA